MRAAVALLLALACASALAGCAGKAADAQAGPAPAAPATRPQAFQGDVFVSTMPGCTQGVCSGGGFATEVYTVPDGSGLTALHLVLGRVDRLDEAVSWKVWCEADDDGACERAFGHGHDALPLTLDLPAAAPSGARLFVELVAPRMTPAALADTAVSLTWGRSHLDGTATLAANASAPAPPPRRAVNVSVDGHSGPCDLVEPSCSQYPGGTQFDFSDSELGGAVVGANLTMTWAAASPLDQELGLDLYGYCGNCAATVHGASPLRLATDGLAFRDGVSIQPYHWDPVLGRSLAGTRTPLHIEGVLWVQPADGADGAAG